MNNGNEATAAPKGIDRRVRRRLRTATTSERDRPSLAPALSGLEWFSADSTARVVQWFDQNEGQRRPSASTGEKKGRLTSHWDASLPEVRLFRSKDERSLSNSTLSHLSERSDVSTNAARRKASGGPRLLPSRISSVPSEFPSLASSRFAVRFPSLLYHPTVDASLRQLFDQIRDEFPEEFFHLIPQLLQLTILQWPEQFFRPDFREKSNEKQRLEREHFISVVKKEKTNEDERRRRRRKYFDDPREEKAALRESLSHAGQLALLKTYHEQIEEELDQQVPSWRAVVAARSEENSSLSSPSSWQSKTKKAGEQLDEESSLLAFSSTASTSASVHPLWKEKLIVVFIEQAMHLLDQSKSLSLPYMSPVVPVRQLVHAYSRSSRLTALLFFALPFAQTGSNE